MINLNSVASHSPSVVSRKTGNEYVLVPVANNIADMNSVFTLNETGAFIWEQINGKRTLQDIIDLLIAEYETDKDNAEKDVFDFINSMKSFLIIS